MKRLFAMILIGLLSMTVTISAQTIELIEVYEADPQLFTQGLEVFEEDKLIYSTGLFGQSKIGIYSLNDQTFQLIDTLPATQFGEGLTQTKNALWHFTWRSGVAYKRPRHDLTLYEIYHYKGEGWGMAYDPKEEVIWTSDGSPILSKRDVNTFEVLAQIEVLDNNIKVEHLNELEFANGMIYANIWMTNDIVQIDPNVGKIINRWDLTPLVDTLVFNDTIADRVLNGIAHIEGNQFYVTGKLYPVIWKVMLNPK